ncbi:MAG: excisionase family DNA-binding protein [Verrucomicrobiaceae bacterium]|nr:excisionase family DNA-binding protein [Verrucomicrobiaceae bacterium]
MKVSASTSHSQFTIHQLAARWNVHPLTIRRRIKAGEIRCLRYSRQLVRIELAEVERYESEARV